MSVIIRLQNLPWSANALDIRQFFHGLSIPEGGVHIVGGEQGDAFIAFSTDEDARQAFCRNNGKIKEVQISLMLSSRTEMQKVIEAARAQSYAAFMQTPSVASMPLPAVVPPVAPTLPVVEVKKDSKDNNRDSDGKRDRKRTRSRSRDRKDRREKNRYRDRSRSRSRDRRERRRRDRSRSRGRSRSRDRDRKTRDRRRSNDRMRDTKKANDIPVWSTQNSNDSSNTQFNFQPNDQIRHNNMQNGFMPNNNFNGRLNRDNWQGQSNMQSDNSTLAFESPADNKSPQNASALANRRFPRNSNFQQDPQYNSPNDQQRTDNSPNCCVKIQPFYGGYGEVRRFFQRAFISNVGIKLINDDFGHRTGVAYVQFGNAQSKHEALLRNGETLNGVNIEVTHAEDEEFDGVVDRFKPDNFSQDSDDSRSQSKFRSRNITKYFNKGECDLKSFTCLTIDDLPTYVKEQDILKMFSALPLTSLILTNKARGGHIAYVKFGTADDAQKAYDEEAAHVIEGKAVTVRPCDDAEFETINEQHNVDLDRKPTPLDTDCISLSRLPQQTTDVEITDFFSDIGIRPVKIHLMNNRLGFTGQAFCEFQTYDDAAKALTKDSASFGPNHVSIQAIPRMEMEGIIFQTQGNAPLPLQQPLLLQQQQQLRPFFPNRPFFPRNNFDGGPRRGGGGPRFMPPRPRYMGNGPEDAPPGCTVYMDNVPYKAGTHEIVEFFEGYDITSNVSRRYNPNNTPSAEAKVVFTSADEAYRAVCEKNGHKIWERPIYLTQA